MATESSGHILFEHRFWLQVLGDHSRFFFKSLGPSEKEEISRTLFFVQEFDNLLVTARKTMSIEELKNFHKVIWQKSLVSPGLCRIFLL